MIIELAGQTPSFPSNTMPIQSFIGEYLSQNGYEKMVKEYGLDLSQLGFNHYLEH